MAVSTAFLIAGLWWPLFFFNFCFQVLSLSLQFIETAAKIGVSWAVRTGLQSLGGRKPIHEKRQHTACCQSSEHWLWETFPARPSTAQHLPRGGVEHVAVSSSRGSQSHPTKYAGLINLKVLLRRFYWLTLLQNVCQGEDNGLGPQSRWHAGAGQCGVLSSQASA